MSRAFLHIGSPKTGTTFLQAVLWQAQSQLQEDGLLLPGRAIHAHFQASLEVRDTPERARYPEQIDGAWKRLLDSVGTWPGDLLISHELFASAPADRARAAVADLAARGYEPHIVLTARDLARQLPAEWQERLKHRSVLTFEEFMREAREQGTITLFERLWAAQDYADILDRWAEGLPAAQVHVVTVPPSGAPPHVLWERFAGVLGLDPAAYSLEVPKENSSLGIEQAVLLREINERLGDRLPMPGTYTGIGKGMLAQRILASHRGGRLVLGGEDLAFARERSEAMNAAMRARGLTMHGDWSDLEVSGDETGVSTARAGVSTEALLQESLDTLADVLAAMGERVTTWDANRHRLQRELREAQARLKEEREHSAVLQAILDRPLGRKLAQAVRRSADRVRGR